MNFMLNLTPQERDVLAEIIKLDNEYEALPPEKRAKFILSTDMRKEIRETLNIEEKQFNVIISRLKSDKKFFMGKPLLDDKNIIHPQLRFKADEEGFQFEVNLIMTTITPTTGKFDKFVDTLHEEMGNKIIEKYADETTFATKELDTAMEHAKAAVNASRDIDASKAKVIEEEDWGIEIELPND
jgi:hypothetical protein